MTDPICQLTEDIEGLCKRCYHLQKSNNDMYGREIYSFDNMYIIFMDFRLFEGRWSIARIYR